MEGGVGQYFIHRTGFTTNISLEKIRGRGFAKDGSLVVTCHCPENTDGMGFLLGDKRAAECPVCGALYGRVGNRISASKWQV